MMPRLSVPFNRAGVALVVALLCALTVNGAGAASNVGAPGQKVSGQAAAQTVRETDRPEFRPTHVSLKAGGVVEWVNTGSIVHDVTFDQYPSITSETMQSGDKYEVKFTIPGMYQYRCSFHPGMNGSVTVSQDT